MLGGRVVGDFLVGQQGDQAVLEGAEAAFDFAFGRGIGGDAVGHAQGGEGALELGVGVEPVGGGGVAEEGQAVGVKTGGQAVGFKERRKWWKWPKWCRWGRRWRRGFCGSGRPG